jgi:23S rRNA (cytosine1962-C5)-methyltransferase
VIQRLTWALPVAGAGAVLAELLSPRGIYARDDADVRLKEGLPLESGPVWGAPPPDRLEIVEHGHRFLVDVQRGHKTGFYLDQRENRLRTAAHCVGTDVLNVFAYTGAFGVYAGRAGARSTVNLDSSVEALAAAEEHLALNGIASQEMVAGDAFQLLRRYRDSGRRFDLVVLDPPKFASSQAQVIGACRGTRTSTCWACAPAPGVLVTFSVPGW